MVEIGKIVTLMPCAGNRALNRPSNHVLVLYGEEGSSSLFTRKGADEEFGGTGYRVSTSHTLCPDCFRDMPQSQAHGARIPYSGDLLRGLIAEYLGGFAVLVRMARAGMARGQQYDSDALRGSEDDFNAGLRGIIARVSQEQVIVSDNVGIQELSDMLALSESLDWQDVATDNTWTSIYAKYESVTSKSLR